MKTQIATTIEQSRRLIACGVDKDTADFYWCDFIPDEPFLAMGEIPRNNDTGEVMCDGDVPAWSLSALLALMPQDLMWQGLYYRLVMGPNGNRWEIEYNDLSVVNNLHRVIADTPIEACVQMIEWLTANGYNLNKS